MPATTGPVREQAAARSSSIMSLRDLLLAQAWREIDLLERLGHGPSQRLLANRSAVEVDEAMARMRPLEKWSGLPATSYMTYVGGNNHVRVARLLDFVEPGERVLDIGIGYGYVTAALMRSGLPGYYCGIDLTNRFVEVTRDGLRSNGLEDAPVHLEVGDLYELTPTWIQRHRPSLVLLLEVLEHVPDTHAAFEVLGRVLPPETSILFTVPLMGRLEGVMGHRSLFDRRRLESLCASGNLTIQYVEPLHNTWALVLATTSPDVPSRLLAAASAPRPDCSTPPPHSYVFEEVDFVGSSLEFERQGRPQRGQAEVSVTPRGLQARITGGDRHARPHYGGLAFPAMAPGILRLQVEYDDPENLEAVYIEGYAGDERVARWKWSLTDDRPAPGVRVIHLLKPSSGGRFRASGIIEAERIERVEIFVELAENADVASFTVTRAAFAGGYAPPG